ncbi:MAG: cytochrome c [Phototrophicaceae bacterium]
MTNAHQRKTRIAYWQIALGIFIGIGILTGAYFALRYTLIADFVEQQQGVDVTDAYTYGETLFVTRGCAGCHTHDVIGSNGDDGPNLTHIADRADVAYITESIVNPNAVIAENCPEEACEANIMPNFGNILSDEQVTALVTFLTTNNQ